MGVTAGGKGNLPLPPQSKKFFPGQNLNQSKIYFSKIYKKITKLTEKKQHLILKNAIQKCDVYFGLYIFFVNFAREPIGPNVTEIFDIL